MTPLEENMKKTERIQQEMFYINEKKVNYAKKLLLQGDSVTNKRSCPTVCWQDSFSYTLTF